MGMAADKPTIPKQMNERVEKIPIGSGIGGGELETTLFIPPGSGPFPLVVINHGKAFGKPKFEPRARYPVASSEFLKRGYLVAVPMRQGYANSSGHLIDAGCNTESNARMQGEDIVSVINRLLERHDVDRHRVLVIGQSYGGIASIAAGENYPAGVKGILNFAGGIKRNEIGCTWEKSMVDAFAAFGAKSMAPSLWFYGDNDSYWGPELPRKAFAAYRSTGGKGRLIAYGTFVGGDAHGMFGSRRGLPIWWPETEQFLKEIGLPTETVFEIESVQRPPKTDFAVLGDVAAVPFLKDKGKENYANFLAMPYPRAFAISDTGSHGWAYEGADPLDRALKNCEKFANKPCQLYAVDDDVVWKGSAP